MQTSKSIRAVHAALTLVALQFVAPVIVAAATVPTAATTGVNTSVTTVDELLRRENEEALNKSRGVSTAANALGAIAKPKPANVPLGFTVDAIYGTDTLKADLTVSGQPITVLPGSVVNGRYRVTSIADGCVVMSPLSSAKPMNSKGGSKAKKTKPHDADTTSAAAPAATVMTTAIGAVRSCWVGAAGSLPTMGQAALGITPPPQPRPLTPLPTANGLPPGAQSFPVTVTPPGASIADNETIISK